ncbi:hypothetical protein [Neobacillus sp. PS3-40]|uniref:hypothetical protein n=1 Tax=Neobacillus sp. PS3-40 TaxID=3070679 RepID=UPI0027DFA936|nr:hypothetical protein [Neobacillus sp. PS3-40]WML46113.1 hypothetical protein RCG20_09580 [Neobacillus sp. PS3-40]
MAEEKKKFVLYEYLLYFWDRKWFFVIVPLITTILIAGTVYALKHDNKYTGVALIFTGSITTKDLTDPDNIKAKYKGIDPDVFVTEKSQVKFTVNGSSQDEVQKNLDHITTSFSKELDKNAKMRLAVSDASLEDLKDRVKTLKASLRMYHEKIDSNQLPADRYANYSDLIIKSEDELTGAQTRVNEMSSDRVFFEKPKVLSENVHAKKTYLPESIAIGIILGILLTIALLMLLKYLGVAKKHYKRD